MIGPGQSATRRLWGFGPIGWIASVILAALIGLVALGVDLQHQYIWLISDVCGTDALFWYLNHVHVWHSLLLMEPTFGLIPGCVAVIALFIAPARVPWWNYGLVIAWATICPMLYPYQFRAPMRFLQAMFGTGFDAYIMLVASWFALNLASCVLLWVLTRSRTVAIATALATVLVSAYMLVMWFLTPVAVTVLKTTGPFDGVTGPFWFATIAGAMLWWALRESRGFEPWACQRCGYDLRAARHKACPECGASILTDVV